jgi:hypothetical protein
MDLGSMDGLALLSSAPVTSFADQAQERKYVRILGRGRDPVRRERISHNGAEKTAFANVTERPDYDRSGGILERLLCSRKWTISLSARTAGVRQGEEEETFIHCSRHHAKDKTAL